jgi:hypothetical protein
VGDKRDSGADKNNCKIFDKKKRSNDRDGWKRSIEETRALSALELDNNNKKKWK